MNGLLRAFLLMSVLSFSPAVLAQPLPYQGRLALDGVPMNGSFSFVFELYSSPTGGDCTSIAAPCLWRDTYPGVPVHGGRFSVSLGAAAQPLPDKIWTTYDEVFLAIQVKGPGESAYTRLGGRQRLIAPPIAARAAAAKSYQVTGNLQVDGAATVGGSLAVAGVFPRYSNNLAADAEATIVNDNGTYKGMVLVGTKKATPPGNTTRRVQFFDNVQVEGKLVLGSDAAPKPVDLGLELVTCDDTASAGCFCPAGKYPLGFGFKKCPTGTDFLYGAWPKTDTASGRHGYVGVCVSHQWNGKAFPTNWVSGWQLLCARVQQPSWPDPPAFPWN